MMVGLVDGAVVLPDGTYIGETDTPYGADPVNSDEATISQGNLCDLNYIDDRRFGGIMSMTFKEFQAKYPYLNAKEGEWHQHQKLPSMP